MADFDGNISAMFAATDSDWARFLPGNNWRGAVNALVDYLINEERCFSSGEIARWFRLHLPGLRFSAPALGEHVRDLFYAGGMANYPDDGYGNPTYPSQVPRTTQGLGRTPSGVQVFVYCPNHTAGFAHAFEVDIPTPGGPATSYPAQTPPTQSVPVQPIQITGANAPQKYATITAKVHDDRRLCIPRSAFELYVHFTGQAMKGGDPVFVSTTDDTVFVSLQATNALTSPQTKTYDLATTRGRVLVPHPSNPFNPGDTYNVTIGSDGLTVDLTQTV